MSGGAALGGDIAGRVSLGGAVIILGEVVLARALPYHDAVARAKRKNPIRAVTDASARTGVMRAALP